jgi:hypothetical protein
MRHRSSPVEIGFWVAVALFGIGCESTVDGGESAASESPVGSGPVGGGASGAPSIPADAGLPRGGSDAQLSDAGLGGRVAGAGGSAAGASAGAGASGGWDGAVSDAAVGDAQTSTAGTEPVIVVVGYQGLRIMSRDLGQTWEHQQTLPDPGGSLDNPTLLRAAAYGNGLFVAAGHHIFTSSDGIAWTERDNYGEPGTTRTEWLGGVAWGNDRFVAAGGYGESWYSLDGITWQAGGDRPGGNHAASRSLAFGNGEFRTASDGGDWWRSEDGESWEQVSGGHSTKIAFCEGDFRDREECPAPWFGHDTYIDDAGWDGNTIRSSEDAITWHDVSVTYRGGIEDVAFGFGPAD